MTFEQEKPAYIEKLRRIIEGTEQILLKYRDSRIVTFDMAKALDKAKKEANLYLTKLEKNEFEVAVVGLEKAGKSSFCNAFIRTEVLPTADERCTYTSTCIRGGDKNYAEVTFYTHDEFKRNLCEKLEKLEIPDSGSYSILNLEESHYESLWEECSESIHRAYEHTLHQDVLDILKNKEELKQFIGGSVKCFKDDELESEEFKRFITSPGHAIAVKEVVIYSTKLDISNKNSSDLNVVMYDVPGFNSPTAMHQEQTLKKMQSADVIIVIANASKPSITSEELRVFTRESDEDGDLLKEKLFVFANKADYATDLDKNKKTTYEEWIQRHKIMDDTVESRARIVFGSAAAALGMESAQQKLQEWGVDDGIETLRKKLKNYYCEERFEVLKKRVNRLLNNINDIFANVPEFTNANVDLGYAEIGHLVMKTGRTLQNDMQEKLDNLRADVNAQAREKKPLSEAIRKEIQNLITPENYNLEDEEINQVHKNIAGVSAAEQPTKLDTELRKKRFIKMYGDFSEKVLKQTTMKHQEVCSRVCELFLEAMKITDPDDSLMKNLRIFCNLETQQSDGSDIYYRSLIERFARDLFEIQIMYAPGTDRFNKFKEESANFFSLGVYYSTTETQNDTQKLTELSKSLQDFPLWRILLYPEYAQMPSCSDLMQKLKQWTNIEDRSKNIEHLVSTVANIYGIRTLDILSDAFMMFRRDENPAMRLENTRKILQNLLDQSDETQKDLLNNIWASDCYVLDVANKHKDYTYDQVKKEFEEDIIALNTVLVNAFVPAIAMDKAFSARESKMLEDIRERLNSEQFDTFIVNNIGSICRSEVGDVIAEKEQRELDAAVINAIKNILVQIKQTA